MSCSWHSGRGTQGPRCPTGRSCLICLPLEEQGGWQCLLFITNKFKAHWFCSVAHKMLYHDIGTLLNVKSHFYFSFSWDIRQKVPLRWVPLSRKPLHRLHPGNGKAATWSPSAASESCHSVWPLSVVLILPHLHRHWASHTWCTCHTRKEVHHMPELEMLLGASCTVILDCRTC